MDQERRIRDEIVGLVVSAGVALRYYVNAAWLLLPAVIGVTHAKRGDRILSCVLCARPAASLYWSGRIQNGGAK